MKLIRRKDLNIEDIRTEEYWNRLRIYSILSNESFENKLEINALVNECLRSRETTLNALKAFKFDREKAGNESSEYNLSCRTYIIDNLPIFTYLKIANEFPGIAIKFRDVNYIDRDTTYFVRIPKEICKNIQIRKEYERIQFKSIGNYRDLYRGKDVLGKKYAHLFLPLGIQNRVGISLNIKENIDLANNLLCSDLVVENQLGDMFEYIFRDDITIKPNSKKRAVFKEVIEYLEELVSEKQDFNEEDIDDFKFQYVDDLVEHLITNFEMLINPLGSKDELEFDFNDQVHIGKLLKDVDLGNISESKGSYLSGYISLNEILNLLNLGYRMYIPLFSDLIDIDKELDRPNNRCFIFPRGIDSNTEAELSKRLKSTYKDIKEWREKSKGHMSEEVSKEYTRYLLPLTHMTRFNLYLSINDIFSIRNQNLEYKEEWMKLFYQRDPLFKK
jgi:hypothetical protein